jgi:microcystin-dependent protein
MKKILLTMLLTFIGYSTLGQIQTYNRPVSLNGSSNIINNAYIVGTLYLQGTNLLITLDNTFAKFSITNNLADTNYVNNSITIATNTLASTNYVDAKIAPLPTTNDIAPLASTNYVATNSMPVGCVLAFARTNPPAGWLECDGSAVSRTTYLNLFDNIGTLYGSGDGTNTFNLPNFKGRTLMGLDVSQPLYDSMSKTGGLNTITLTTNNLPAHTHTATNSYDGNHIGHIDTTASRVVNSVLAGGYGLMDSGTHTHTINVLSTGGGKAFTNLPPYAIVKYFIKY